jgi:hypothetical protein
MSYSIHGIGRVTLEKKHDVGCSSLPHKMTNPRHIKDTIVKVKYLKYLRENAGVYVHGLSRKGCSKTIKEKNKMLI